MAKSSTTHVFHMGKPITNVEITYRGELLLHTIQHQGPKSKSLDKPLHADRIMESHWIGPSQRIRYNWLQEKYKK